MPKPRRSTSRSLYHKLVVPLVLLVLLQAVVFLVAVGGTGILEELEYKSYQLLSFQLESHASDVQEYFVNVAENLRLAVEEFSMDFLQRMTDKGIGIEALRTDPAAVGAALEAAMPSLRDYLALNTRVSGAFIMLDASIYPQGNSRACLYIRDIAPQIYSPTYSDWLLERGPSSIAREYSFPLDSKWSYEHGLAESPSADSFFLHPLQATRQGYADGNLMDCGYWSRPFQLYEDDMHIITYSLPLLDAEGRAYGVFGVEISMNILGGLLPGLSVADLQGFYLFSDVGDGTILSGMLFSEGPLTQRFLASEPRWVGYRDIRDIRAQRYRTQYSALETVAGVGRPLRLYGPSSAFVVDEWYLYGFVPEHQLRATYRHTLQAVAIALGISSLTALVVLLLTARRITKPVALLVKQVEEQDPDEPAHLPTVSIVEIDELTAALERLSMRAVTAAARLSTIIKMMGLPMGGFEEDDRRNRVFLTETLTQLLKMDMPSGGGYLPLDQWRKLLESITRAPEDGYDNVYRVLDAQPESSPQYLRIEMGKEEEGRIGVVSDVTQEVLEKRRLEHERDYDSLTNLPNRRYFKERAKEMFQERPDTIGALLFLDMDNLKFINDAYGHDTGDQYLRMMATALEAFSVYGGLVSRLSGDEFVVLLYGFDAEEDIRAIIREVIGRSHALYITAPDGTQQRLRFSTGVTWYPRDTTSLDMMLRYADFAMYEIKQNNKGYIGEFDKGAYQSKSFLTDKQGLFASMLENEEIAFALQPVVDARSGEIFAYEALLRPMTPGLRSPLEVLQLAARVSKLYQLERLIAFSIFGWLRNHVDLMGERRLLFNTIASHCLNDGDARLIEETYGDLFPYTIMEITESEQASPNVLDRKVSLVRRLGGQIAIDDYGSGYSNELNILLTEPNIIKIDMSIIRDIHRDENRKQIVRNAIAYARPRGIAIVGEGVENAMEMHALIDLGVDYLQGYYIARPQFSLEEVPEEIRREIRGLAGTLRESR